MFFYLYRLGQWLVYFSLFLPLVVVDSFVFPFITPRNFLFRLFMTLGVGVVVLLWLNFKELRPRTTWLNATVLAVVGLKIVSSVFGINFFNSFWSSYERMEGIVTWLFFAVLYFLIITVFRTQKEWRMLFRVALVPAVLVALYGFGQIMGWTDLVARQSRIESRLGNAAYVGAYMLINIGIAAVVFLKDDNKVWRWLAGFFLVLFHGAMFLSATRGAIIGWLAGILVGMIAYFFVGSKKKVKIAAGGALVFLIFFAGILWLSRDASWVKNTEWMRRMTTISVSDQTVRSRLLVWRMGWEGFLDRPVFGWGIENFSYVFNKYYDPLVPETWVDRAHNNLIDQLAMGGIATFAAYVFLLFLPGYYFWRYRKKDVTTSIVLFSLWVAYVVQNQFVFDSLNTYVLFFLILGYAWWIRQDHRGLAASVNNFQKHSYNLNYNTWLAGGLIVAIVMGNAILSVPAYSANLLTIRALNTSRKDPKKSFELLKEALAKDSFGNKEIVLQSQFFLQNVLRNKNLSDDFKTEFLLYFIKKTEDVLDREPYDVRAMLALASLYQTARVLNPLYLEKEREILARALSWGPKRVDVYYSMAQTYIFEKNYEKAEEYLRRAVAIASHDPSVQKDLVARMNLLAVLQLAGKGPEAVKYAAVIERNFPDVLKSKNYAETLGKIYAQFASWEKAVAIYELLVEREPANIDYWVSLGNVYTTLGETDKAQAAFQKAAQLQNRIKEKE